MWIFTEKKNYNLSHSLVLEGLEVCGAVGRSVLAKLKPCFFPLMAAVVEGPVEIIILVNGSSNFKFNVNKFILSIPSINLELSLSTP
jgi:hypothetical protein